MSYPKTDKGQCRRAIFSDGRRTRSEELWELDEEEDEDEEEI